MQLYTDEYAMQQYSQDKTIYSKSCFGVKRDLNYGYKSPKIYETYFVALLNECWWSTQWVIFKKEFR